MSDNFPVRRSLNVLSFLMNIYRYVTYYTILWCYEIHFIILLYYDNMLTKENIYWYVYSTFIFKVIPDMKYVFAFPVDYCTEVDLILFCKYLNLNI